MTSNPAQLAGPGSHRQVELRWSISISKLNRLDMDHDLTIGGGGKRRLERSHWTIHKLVGLVTGLEEQF